MIKPRAIFILLILTLTGITRAQGLKILGNDHLIDERTSYAVFEGRPPAFKNRLTLDFEISPDKTNEVSSVGYILRIKNEEAQTTYNVLFNDQGGNTLFKLNHEGQDVLLTAELNKAELQANPWIHMQLEFHLKADSVTMRINDHAFARANVPLPDSWRPDITFGRSDYMIDVPTFKLRNLTVSGDKKRFHFPLNENEGTAVHDAKKQLVGRVQQPVWLINDAYYWRRATTEMRSSTVAASGMNEATQEVYYLNADSISFYNLRTGSTRTLTYANACPITMRLGTNFIDTISNSIYVYEVSDLLQGRTTVARLNLQTLEWKAVSEETLPMQLHHHGNYWDAERRRYKLYGGFGNAKYNGNFYAFDLTTNTWETATHTGERVTPRYFTSMGSPDRGRTLYVFAGMGNQSGDQSVGRVYYYDLYSIDLKENAIRKRWEIAWKKENMVPVRNLVAAADTAFYTLCYPEHVSHSYLRLYRFSTTTGEHEVLGDSIPIVSEKITTNANLYANPHANELVAVVQEFDNDDTASTLRIYTLACPPLTKQELIFDARKKGLPARLLLGIPFVVAIAIVVYSAGRKKKEESKENKAQKETDEEPQSKEQPAPAPPALQPNIERANALYLFGEFALHDRNNRDISYMLGTKLRQTFLLILHHSLHNGIGTQELSEILWPNKPEDKVKNSRGVAINNLRKVLAEVDGAKLVHEKGMYRIIFDANIFYCDYVNCLDLLNTLIEPRQRAELASIVSRGKFLKSADTDFLDSFKELLERKLEPVLLHETPQAIDEAAYDIALALSEALFRIDPLSEEALQFSITALGKLKMTDEAKRRFARFATEYRETLGTEYKKGVEDFM